MARPRPRLLLVQHAAFDAGPLLAGLGERGYTPRCTRVATYLLNNLGTGDATARFSASATALIAWPMRSVAESVVGYGAQ